MPSVEYCPTVPAGTGAGSAGVLDMWGPISQLTPLGSMINIIPILKLVDGINELEAHNTIQMAEFKVAQRLAETTRNETPKNVEKFELFEVDPSLPRVVYIFSFVTYHITPEQAHSTLAFYGLSVDESLPSFIHPNEFLDGALTADARKGRSGELSSWGLMNHPVVLTLLREHGKRLNFLGVILQRTRFLSEYGKHVTAQATSQLARLVGADGIITTRTSPSGNNMIEIMLTLKACEEKGIKTVTLAPEWGGFDGTEQPLVFHLPEADAVISTCSMDRIIEAPAPKKVIGLGDNKLFTIAGGEQPISPWGELVLDTRTSIAEGIDFLGMNNYTCKVY
jgi:glycine reductase